MVDTISYLIISYNTISYHNSLAFVIDDASLTAFNDGAPNLGTAIGAPIAGPTLQVQA